MGGNVGMEVMRKNEIRMEMVKGGRIGGNDVRVNVEIMGNLGEMKVVRRGGKEKVDGGGGEEVESLFGVRG